MDFDGLLTVYKSGFNYDSLDYAKWFIGCRRDDEIFTVTEGGKVISAGYTVFKKADIFGKKQNIAYLSALSTLEEFRGKQKISLVIEQALNCLYAKGCDIALLNPFDFSYYRRYGFTNVSYVKTLKFIGGRNFITKKIDKADFDAVVELENSLYMRADNKLISDAVRVKLKMEEYGADNISGFLVYHMDSPIAFYFLEGDEIAYFGTNNLDLFLSDNMLCGKILTVQSKEGEPFVQGRIVNALKVLKNYNYSCSGNLIKTFKITDSIIKDNNICVTIKVLDGKGNVQISKLDDAMEVDISLLTHYIFNGYDNLFLKKFNAFPDKF